MFAIVITEFDCNNFQWKTYKPSSQYQFSMSLKCLYIIWSLWYAACSNGRKQAFSVVLLKVLFVLECIIKTRHSPKIEMTCQVLSKHLIHKICSKIVFYFRDWVPCSLTGKQLHKIVSILLNILIQESHFHLHQLWLDTKTSPTCFVKKFKRW